MHKKRILSLLMAGAMFMVSPVAAFGANLDVYEEDDPKHGDPNSDDTSLKSVTIYGGEVDIDGSDITVKYRLTDYPSESDIFIKVTDDDKTYEDWRMESTYWVRVNIVDEHYAEVEDLRTDDGGKTWTFTVRAADGETTQDYTIHIELVEDAFNCGHDSYEWVQYVGHGQVGEDADGEHALRCTVCGKYKPGGARDVETEFCEWELIDEGYNRTMEKEGLADLYQCSVCGAYKVYFHNTGYEKVLEQGEDVDEARRVESINEEARNAFGTEPREDTPMMYEGRPDEEEFLDEWNAEQEEKQEALEEALKHGNGTWQKDGIGWWFRFHDGSYPQNTWWLCTTDGGSGWYHFDSEGYMHHGWLAGSDGHTYYLHDTEDGNYGAMLIGWQWIDGNGDGLKECYYFNQDDTNSLGLPQGAMLKNTTTPDGYTVNANGEWVVNGVVQTM